MANAYAKPLPPVLSQLIQDYGEMAYIHGRETARALFRAELGLSMNRAQEQKDEVELLDRVNVKREKLVDAIRELL